MSQVNQTSLKVWADNDTMHGTDYDNERNLLVTAINDNATQISGMYTKSQIDGKFTAVATTVTIAQGTVYPANSITGQLFYRTDLKTLSSYDGTLAAWQPATVKAGTGITVGTDGTVSIANGSTTAAGSLQVGDGLNIASGVVSARDLMWMIHMGIGGF